MKPWMHILAAVLAAGMIGSQTPPAMAAEDAPAVQRGDEQDRLDDFFRRSWERDLARSPIRQTRLGRREGLDRWDEIGPAARAATEQALRADLAELETFDPARLDRQGRLSLRMYSEQAQSRLQALEWERHGYLLTQMGGLHTR